MAKNYVTRIDSMLVPDLGVSPYCEHRTTNAKALENLDWQSPRLGVYKVTRLRPQSGK
ncbi:MAG: hypothetical protein JWP34_5213 [Massilia sp.]|jgi:hypothetical protein|nr:hypothetical protein [Massilia sp.]